jgi:integrase
MPRPRRDGAPPAPPNKRRLTDTYVSRVRPRDRAFIVWDTKTAGLAVVVQPTGTRVFKFVYRRGGAPRWYTIGRATTIGLAAARRIAIGLAHQVAEGADPQASRVAERGRGTFAELAARYRDEHAKKENRSWRQADALVDKYVNPTIGKLRAADVRRDDVKKMFRRLDDTPVLANQVLAALSAIYSWAIREEIVDANPARLIERNETASRARVLDDSEVTRLWPEFDAALKLILLTGQRPGEVGGMRKESVRDGWWHLPGAPDPKTGWPGTKNGEDHMVFLSAPARELIDAHLAPGRRPRPADLMRRIVAKLGIERVTPHHLRRTCP